MGKLVTVIMPVYNTGWRLEKSVNSILQSDYRDIELLIIDDGSGKETADLCDVLGQKDDRVKVIHQKNGGVSVARNTGMEHAKGEYVVFVDSDDFLEANMISRLTEIAEKENADMVVGGYRECYDDGREKEIGCTGNVVIKQGGEILTDFFTTNNIGWTAWAKLYRLDRIKSVCFPEGKKIAEDMFFVYKTLKTIDKIAIYGFPVYRYVLNNDSVMADTDCLKFFDSFYLTREVFKDPETGEQYKSEKAVFYIRNVLFFFRYLYIKDKKGTARAEINKIKKIFLTDVEECKANMNVRMKAETCMLKRMPWLFRVYAKLADNYRKNTFKKRKKEK